MTLKEDHITINKEIMESNEHPLDGLLREDRLPHVWCAGCGLGSVLNCYLQAIVDAGIDIDTVATVSGIGCTGRASGYVNGDAFHTTHGRAIPFAVGLKLAQPDGLVAVISGDGDLASIGGNHLIHAARRNLDLLVICVNNFNYGMTGGQGGPTTPKDAWTTTTQFGNIEPAFNMVHLMASSGATYVARWSSNQVVRMRDTFEEAMTKNGFRFIEIISPCPTTYGRRNQYREGIDMLKMFQNRVTIKHGMDTAKTKLPEIGTEEENHHPIYVGKFIDKTEETKSYLERIQDLWDRAQKKGK